MSAIFKNSKKKLTQSELRKLMNDHKGKSKEPKKIDSPLAKYNEQGQLTCILCKWVVRSGAVWPLHVNSKKHKENIEIAKKLKERTNNYTTAAKRPSSPPPTQVPEKKLKGILKNSHNTMVEKMSTDEPNQNPTDSIVSITQQKLSIRPKNTEEVGKTEEVLESKDRLPEGFFDDPKLDAKARNQEYKDPIEEEWDKFLKVIKEADNESNAIIAEDQEEATTERQIDEIDEQIKKLSRVLDLEKQKEVVVAHTNESRNQSMQEDTNEDVDEDFEEIFDWRSKKSFRK